MNRTVRAMLLSVGLLVAGGLCYAVFVEHVLDREGLVHLSIKSKAAREPLQMAGLGVLGLAGSGLVGLAPSLRNRQWGPLFGLGLPLSSGALVGLGAFSLGRTALVLAMVIAAPAVLTCLLACLVPPRAKPGLGRFVLRSWMATGLLVGLGLIAVTGLSLAEKAAPRVPWSSLLAASACGALVQMAARYVALHGGDVAGIARDHQQVREVHDTPSIRSVADRLHPFIEEGRAVDEYTGLADELSRVAHQGPAAAPSFPAGAPAIPTAHMAGAGSLRAAAFALPMALLVPVLGLPAALVVAGLLLPFTCAAFAPKEEAVPRWAWFAGAILLAAGGALAAELLPLVPVATLLGAAFGVPYLIALLVSFRPRALPAHLGYLRLRHAELLQQRWVRDVARGVALALAALLLPPLLWAASSFLGIALRPLPWPILLAFAAGGASWAFAGWLAGPGAASHREALGAQHARQVQERALAHRRFLERLEMT